VYRLERVFNCRDDQFAKWNKRDNGRVSMKMVEAVIRHHKVDDVKNALARLGVQGMTASEVRGFGRQKGHEESYSGVAITFNFLPKVKLEIVVSDEQVKAVCNAIMKSASTGKIGDGKIFVLDLDETVRIRTGEIGDQAI
jgi:nitrogen regulatory protein P-II 1